MANVENPYQTMLENNLVITSYTGDKNYNIKLNIHDIQTLDASLLQILLTFYVYNTQTKVSDKLIAVFSSSENYEYLEKIYNNQPINIYELLPDLASYDSIGLHIEITSGVSYYDSIMFKVDFGINPQTFEMYLTRYLLQYIFINNSSYLFDSGDFHIHATIIAEDDWLKGNPAYDLFVGELIDYFNNYFKIDAYLDINEGKPIIYVSPVLLPEGYKLRLLDIDNEISVTANDIDMRNLTNPITDEDGIVKWFDMGTMIIDDFSSITFRIPSGVVALLKDDSGYFYNSVTRRVIINTPTTFPEIITGAGYSYKNWYSDDDCSITSSDITTNVASYVATITAYADFDYTKLNLYYGYISWDESKARIKANFDGTYVFVNSGDRILSYSSLFPSTKTIDVHIYLNDTTNVESTIFGMDLYNFDREMQDSQNVAEFDVFTDDDGTYIAYSYNTVYNSSDLLIEFYL